MIFYKSIILLVEESYDGHTGFILNRPGGILFMKNETNTSLRITALGGISSDGGFGAKDGFK